MQRKHQPADRTGVVNAQAELLTNLYGQDEQHQNSNTDSSPSNSHATSSITAATGHLQEVIQQASAHRNQHPAYRTGVTNAQAELLTNIYGHDEQHQDPTTDTSQSTSAIGHPQGVSPQASTSGTPPAD